MIKPTPNTKPRAKAVPGAANAPLSPRELIDLYFLDARSKLIEIAAFLDRIERATRAHASTPRAMKVEDYRLADFKKALKVVAGEDEGKAKAVQMIFSDPTLDPLDSALGMKGATGAYKGNRKP